MATPKQEEPKLRYVTIEETEGGMIKAEYNTMLEIIRDLNLTDKSILDLAKASLGDELELFQARNGDGPIWGPTCFVLKAR